MGKFSLCTTFEWSKRLKEYFINANPTSILSLKTVAVPLFPTIYLPPMKSTKTQQLGTNKAGPQLSIIIQNHQFMNKNLHQSDEPHNTVRRSNTPPICSVMTLLKR